MEIMTAEQAAEAAKGLTFEKVWEALMESRKQSEAAEAAWRKQMEEMRAESNKAIADANRIVGKLGNSLGELTESMFSAELWRKFEEIGFPVSRQSRNMRFTENKQTIAEADVFIENGEYAIPVEVKTNLSNEDVDWHLERIEKIRRYMDGHRDSRKLVGAVAGGTVHENVLVYAQRKGLFVIIPSGDSATIAAAPEGFKARVWA